jgi:predicted Zn-dependent peptidase
MPQYEEADITGRNMEVPPHPSSVKVIADTMEKPLLDNRSYRVIQLPNQLEILLVHDTDTDKAAAAMDVNVGSLSDPDDLPGTAHAVEHLCFMGTRKVCDRYTSLPLTPTTQTNTDFFPPSIQKRTTIARI